MFTKRPEQVGLGRNGSDVTKRESALEAAIPLEFMEFYV
jgi:hypothetical protein